MPCIQPFFNLLLFFLYLLDDFDDNDDIDGNNDDDHDYFGKASCLRESMHDRCIFLNVLH